MSSLPLREKNREPLYARVEAALRAEIERLLAPGDALPTEPELEARFGVSRITVRRAMDELEADGLIVRVQGRGTFVGKPRIRQDATLLISWTEALARMGIATSTAWTVIDTIDLPQSLSMLLDCPVGTSTARITRLKVANGEPVCLMTNYLVPRFAVLVASGLVDDSIYATLASIGTKPVAASDRIEARAASANEAAKLGIAERSPLLQVTRVAYDDSRRPLYVAVVANRADRVVYEMSVGERL